MATPLSVPEKNVTSNMAVSFPNIKMSSRSERDLGRDVGEHLR